MDRRLGDGDYVAFKIFHADQVAILDVGALQYMLKDITRHYSLATVGQVPSIVMIAVPQGTENYVKDQVKQHFGIQ